MSSTLSLPPRRLALSIVTILASGALGTLIREYLLGLDATPRTHAHGLAHISTWSGEVPWMLLAINFVGVFLAVVLLRWPLRHHDPNDLMRLLLITGFLGGLTSYSSLLVSLGQIWHDSVVAGVGVGAGAVVSGVLGAWLGLRVRHR